MKKVWLVTIHDIFNNGADNTVEEKYFIFKDNNKAVDTIRKMMTDQEYKEDWIDVSFDKNGKEQVDYLSFSNKENIFNSISVFFEEKNIIV